jgi:hypothetical protein
MVVSGKWQFECAITSHRYDGVAKSCKRKEQQKYAYQLVLLGTAYLTP